jgi:hypothetical protein
MSENLEHSFCAIKGKSEYNPQDLSVIYQLRGFTQRLVSGGHHSIMEGLPKI